MAETYTAVINGVPTPISVEPPRGKTMKDIATFTPEEKKFVRDQVVNHVQTQSAQPSSPQSDQPAPAEAPQGVGEFFSQVGGNLANVPRNNWGILRDAFQAAGYRGGDNPEGLAAAQRLPKELKAGFITPVTSELGKAWDALKAPNDNPSLLDNLKAGVAVPYHVGKALAPIIGAMLGGPGGAMAGYGAQQALGGGEKIASGDTTGGLADIATQGILQSMPKITEGAGYIARKAAPILYRGTVNPTPGMPPVDINNAMDMAIKEGVTPGIKSVNKMRETSAGETELLRRDYEDSAMKGEGVPANRASQAIRDVIQDYNRGGVSGVMSEKINRLFDENYRRVLEEPYIESSGIIPTDRAADIKTNNAEQASYAGPAREGADPAANVYHQTIARVMREGVEKLINPARGYHDAAAINADIKTRIDLANMLHNALRTGSGVVRGELPAAGAMAAATMSGIGGRHMTGLGMLSIAAMLHSNPALARLAIAAGHAGYGPLSQFTNANAKLGQATQNIPDIDELNRQLSQSSLLGR